MTDASAEPLDGQTDGQINAPINGPFDRRRLIVTSVRSLVVVAGLLTAYLLAPIGAATDVLPFWRAVIGVAVLVAVVAMQIRAVVRSDYPMFRAVEALAVAIPLLLVLAAGTYLGLSQADPAAFSEELDSVGALYLSMMTMTTVGFGDIAAVSQGARIAVMAQMVLNVVVIGVVVRVVFRLAGASARRRVDATS